MSSSRYIEIVSTHRDRTMYPLVSDFIVPISGSNGCNNPKNYLDPISSSAPIYIFQRASIDNFGTTNSGTNINPGLGISGSTPPPNPYVPGGTNTVYRAFVTQGGYKGYIFTDTDIQENRLVVDSTPSSGVVLSLDVPLSYNNYATQQNYVVYDLSGAMSNDPLWNPITTGTPLYDFRKIYCTQPFDIFGNPCPTLRRLFVGYWLKKEPFIGGLVVGLPEYSQIIDYDPDKRQVLLDKEIPLPGTGFPQGIYSVRPTIPTNKFRGAVINGTTQLLNGFMIADQLISPNTFKVLPGLATPLINGQDPGYAGNYIFFTPQSADPAVNVNFPVIPNNNEIQKDYYYRIVSYPADDTFVLDRDINLSAFYNSILDERPVEVLPVTSDNFVPLEYNGTIVSQNQAVCYEIALMSITLPNVPLVSGSRIAFYPYVYVQLENATDPNGGTKGIIYSNNPPAHKALFVVPIIDIRTPLISPFVRLEGFGIVQSVKFKPNDYLHFRVYLPDGSPFEPVLDDNISPVPPNPLLQISAVFSIKRL